MRWKNIPVKGKSMSSSKHEAGTLEVEFPSKVEYEEAEASESFEYQATESPFCTLGGKQSEHRIYHNLVKFYGDNGNWGPARAAVIGRSLQ